jgi:hypothetical protein
VLDEMRRIHEEQDEAHEQEAAREKLSKALSG